MATEIKFGQDNVDVVNKLMLDGLDFDKVSSAIIHKFFKDNVIFTSKTDFRSLNTPFIVIGREMGKLKEFKICFTRSIYKNPAIADNQVAFDALVTDTVIQEDDVQGILNQMGRHDYTWTASVVILGRYKSTLHMRRIEKGEIVTKRMKFGFECDIFSIEMFGTSNGVQPKSTF